MEEGEGGMIWENSIETCTFSSVKQISSPGWMHETSAGALGRPREMGWGRRREGGSGWGTHVNPWLIHVNVWQKPLQYCKIISLQLVKINEKKRILSAEERIKLIWKEKQKSSRGRESYVMISSCLLWWFQKCPDSCPFRYLLFQLLCII